MDLLDSQIKQSCKLALPEGLKELMADISREVLRAQPTDLYQFITDYLSALLVSREHLSIASRVCGDICDNICHTPLDDELRKIGLSEKDVVSAVKTVKEFFDRGDGQEENLMMSLLKDTDISEHQLPAVAEVVREAFIRHKLKAQPPLDIVSYQAMDDVTRAVKHTLDLYKKTEPSEHQKCVMAQKIQAAYRAYKVRRGFSKEIVEIQKHHRPSLTSGKSIRFESEVEYTSYDASQDTDDVDVVHKSVRTESSASVAGSFLQLHQTRPYSAMDHELEEKQQRVHTYVEYDEDDGKKKEINFHSTNELIEDEANYADNDSEGSVPDVSRLPEVDDNDIGQNDIGENVEIGETEGDKTNDLKNVEGKSTPCNSIETLEGDSTSDAVGTPKGYEEDDEDHFYV